jgi:hypothetical protein
MKVKKISITSSPVTTNIGFARTIMLKADADCEAAINSNTAFQTYYADELIMLPLDEEIQNITVKGTSGTLRTWAW